MVIAPILRAKKTKLNKKTALAVVRLPFDLALTPLWPHSGPILALLCVVLYFRPPSSKNFLGRSTGLLWPFMAIFIWRENGLAAWCRYKRKTYGFLVMVSPMDSIFTGQAKLSRAVEKNNF
jgi:hypothetical protein